MTSATLFREGDDLDELLAELDEEFPGQIRVLEVSHTREGGVMGFFARPRVAVHYTIEDTMSSAPSTSQQRVIAAQQAAADEHADPIDALIAAAEMVETGQSHGGVIDEVLDGGAGEPNNVEFARMLLDIAARKAAERGVELPAASGSITPEVPAKVTRAVTAAKQTKRAEQQAQIEAQTAAAAAGFAQAEFATVETPTAETPVAEEPVATEGPAVKPKAVRVRKPRTTTKTTKTTRATKAASADAAIVADQPAEDATADVTATVTADVTADVTVEQPATETAETPVAETPVAEAAAVEATVADEAQAAERAEPATATDAVSEEAVSDPAEQPVIEPAPKQRAVRVRKPRIAKTPRSRKAAAAASADNAVEAVTEAPSQTPDETITEAPQTSAPEENAIAATAEISEPEHTLSIADLHEPDERLALRRRLSELGVPFDRIPTDAPHRYAAIEQLVARLPQPASLPETADQVVVIAGPASQAARTAALMIKRMALLPQHVWSYRCPGAAELTEHEIRDVGHATAIAGAARKSGNDPKPYTAQSTLVVVGLDEFEGEGEELDGPPAASVIRALGPDTFWLHVDATRKASDTAALVREVGKPTALVVSGAARTSSPASVWELNVPIAMLDGRPATRSAWAVLMLEKLSETAE